MFRKLLAAVLVLMLAFSGISVMAKGQDTGRDCGIYTTDKAIEYRDTITVTAEGGKFQVGFVTLQFPKNFVNADKLPVTFDVTVNAEDGRPGITITPDTNEFNGTVKIKVQPYRGLLYDTVLEENVEVSIKANNIKVYHFSRYAFS